MRACFLAFCALVLVTHVAPPVLAQRSTELSGDYWAECFAVFTGMAAVLLAQGGPPPAQNAQNGAQDGARDPAAASGQGPADRFLALSEQAALRWLDSQGAGQEAGRDSGRDSGGALGGNRAHLMTGLEQAVDQAIRTAALRSDFAAYLRRTSDRCIAAMNS